MMNRARNRINPAARSQTSLRRIRRSVHATVIGRNVNLAGRLSSANRRPLEERGDLVLVDSPDVVDELPVQVDEEGVLFNEGVAISRDTLLQLEKHIALVHADGWMEYEDEVIARKIVIRYAGDAKFKGVESSLPVYAVTCDDGG